MTSLRRFLSDIGLAYRWADRLIPSQRHWTPPATGSYFIRCSDGSVWRTRRIYLRDQQVQLVAEAGDERVYVGARELERDYQIVSGRFAG